MYRGYSPTYTSIFYNLLVLLFIVPAIQKMLFELALYLVFRHCELKVESDVSLLPKGWAELFISRFLCNSPYLEDYSWLSDSSVLDGGL